MQRERPGCEDFFQSALSAAFEVSRFGVDPVRATRASKMRRRTGVQYYNLQCRCEKKGRPYRALRRNLYLLARWR